MEPAFPTASWQRSAPEAVDMQPAALTQARTWFDERLGERPGRLVVVRHGHLVLEHYHGMAATARPGIASAAKSIYSNVLGSVIAEGKLASADERVVDYYPELMDVAEGQGNRPGRYAFAANRDITFRHLICNVSGYMKPGEAPGRVFNYQTWGMNILTHALARLYGLWDTADPEGSRGFQVLIQDKLARPIGAEWRYTCHTPPFNERLQQGARTEVFGYYTGVQSTALDLARVGWLWCNGGSWGQTQVVPEDWLRQSMRVAPDIVAHCPREEWIYGHGIWTNERGMLWPNLPTEACTASGAGGHYWTVFPSAGLVVVQNPGPLHANDRADMANPKLLRMLLDACG